ncbi:MAG: DUF3368 domain-containing protein [Candidatus Freyarchaeum deiterrae]
MPWLKQRQRNYGKSDCKHYCYFKFSTYQKIEHTSKSRGKSLYTTREVVEEIKFGIERGVTPDAEWGRINILEMNSEETELFYKLAEKLGKGEASCIAVAKTRGFKILTDDWDARRHAQKLSVPVSGTIGILVLAVDKKIVTKEQGNHLLSEMIKMGFYSPVESLDEVL